MNKIRSSSRCIFFVSIMTLIVCCRQSNQETESIPDNSQTSLDWPGTYSGVVPCSDCEGIETTITINRDLTYSLTTIQRGKSSEPLSHTGKFIWNDAGSSILLGGLSEGPSQYQVGENVLIQLDNKGRKIKGKLAEQYRLVRTVTSTLDRARWNLIELLGKSFARSAAHVNFDIRENQMNGYGWCNTFHCNFELLSDDGIKFSEIIATTRMCPDTTTEKQFLNMFRSVDSYTLHENILILSRGKAAPMAKFHGVQNVRQ